MKRFFQLIFLISLFLCGMSNSLSATIVKARLDSAYLIMGNKTTLHLEVVQPKSVVGRISVFDNIGASDFVAINGDSIELSRNFTADTTSLGADKLQINYKIPIQAFDSGLYYIEPLKYISGRDTVSSNRLVLKVIPIGVNPEEDISPMSDVIDNTSDSFFDFLPDFLVDYWWIVLIGIVLLAAVIYIILKYLNRRRKSFQQNLVLPPYEEALKALNELKTDKLCEKGYAKGYYTRLTDIFRRYLYRRFNVSAQEMTSAQLIDTIKHNQELSKYRHDFITVLDLADLVKFAKIIPHSDDNISSFHIVENFVLNTKPETQTDDNNKTSEEKEVTHES